MPKLCFGKSPSFAEQNSWPCSSRVSYVRVYQAAGVGWQDPGQLRGATSLDPMNLRRIIPTEEASHFPIRTRGQAPGGILGASALFGNFFRAALFIFQK